MSTTRKIAHNTGVQLIGKIISTLLGLFAVGIMTRYLSQEEFGWYTTAIGFLQFSSILIDFGLIPVTAQMLSEAKGQEERLFKNILTFRFWSALFFFLLIPGVAFFFPYPHEVKIAIALLSLSFFGISMNQVLTGFFQTTLKMHLHAIGEVLGRIILVTGVFFFSRHSGAFYPMMAMVSVSNIGFTLFMILKAKNYTKIGFAYDWNIWKRIFTKMWPIAISILFNVMYLKGDILILAAYKTQTEVALYGAPYKVLDIITQTAMMLMGVMLPLLSYAWSQNMKEEFKYRFSQSFDGMMLFALPMTAGLILLAQKIMLLIAGDKYIDSTYLLQILSLAVFGVYLGAIFGHASVAINRQKQTIWIYVTNAILTVTGYFIFIPKYGAIGAAWMSVFSELYAGVLLAVVILYYTKVKISITPFLKILFSTLIMSGVLFLLPDWNIFFLIPVGMMVYGSSILVTKAVSVKTLKEILKIQSV